MERTELSFTLNFDSPQTFEIAISIMLLIPQKARSCFVTQLHFLGTHMDISTVLTAALT